MDGLREVNTSSVPQQNRNAKSAVAERTVEPPPSGEKKAKLDPAVVAQGRQETAEQQKQVAENSREQVRDAVQQLNDYAQSVQRTLNFHYDEDAERAVVQVIDRETNELVRQIPDVQAVEMARKLNTEDQVTLLDVKV